MIWKGRWLPILGILAVPFFVDSQTQTAPAQKETGPSAGAAREVRFPAFEEQTLENGLRIVVIEHHEQPMVSLQLRLKAGRVFQPADQVGVATAASDLLSQGTTKRSAKEIANSIEFVGSSLSVGASFESGTVSTAVTSDQVDLGFELLEDVVLHPAFPEGELERWRKQALSNLTIGSQKSNYLAETGLRRLLYGEHPYSFATSGKIKDIEKLTRLNVIAFHRAHYIPNQTLLAVIGDITPADAFARARRAFGGWKSDAASTIPEVKAEAQKGHTIQVIDMPQAVQSEIRIGQQSLAFRDPDLYISRVYNALLGGSTGRLAQELRQKRGLTYGATSDFFTPSQSGTFIIRTSTKTASTVEAVTAALDVVRDFAKDPVPVAELNAAKIGITGAFPLEIETPVGIAAKVLEAMQFGLNREFIEQYNENISHVTASDLQRFARERIHPDDMAIVVAGNAKEFSAELKQRLGEFEMISAKQLQ